MDLARQFLWASPALLLTAVFFWLIYWDYRKRRLAYEERRLMIERGVTPPATFSPWGGWPAVKQHEQQLLYEERRLRIEKGLPVPPLPPLPEPKRWTAADYLLRGISMLCLGIGGAIAYVALGSSALEEAEHARAWAAGLSPLLALSGLGMIAVGRIVGAQEAKKPRSE